MPGTEVKPSRPASYGFRYTDEQRRAVVDLLALAMKVVRGEQPFEVLRNQYPIRAKFDSLGNWKEPTGVQYDLDARFLNKWSGFAVIGNPSKRDPRIFEAEYFQLDLTPGLPGLPLEELESLLQLKVEPGDGATPGQLGGGVHRSNGPTDRPGFVFDRRTYTYEPLNPPKGDIRIRVEFDFLDSDASGDRRPTTLKGVMIRRAALSPEEIKQRDQKKLGHLPQTGQRCQKDGQYVPCFADDDLTAQARIANTKMTGAPIPLRRRPLTAASNSRTPRPSAIARSISTAS